MELRQFIESGIIEIYCMGIASEEEKNAVESYAAQFSQVRDEINSVNRALMNYAAASGKTSSPSLKKKILDVIAAQNPPPLLSEQRNIQWWIDYLDFLNLESPTEYEIHLVDLPGDKRTTNYAAWAKKGARVEESHSDEDEYLLMIKGSCTITVNGQTTEHHPGDLIYIPKGTVHLAIAISDEPMLVIGQRVAA